MLGTFIKDETGGVAVAYGAFALGLTAAIVGMAGLVGSVLDHSYSAIPYEASDRAPAIESFSQAAVYLDGSYLREAFGRLLSGT
jgi:Flp pilus assembly pilin Flp